MSHYIMSDRLNHTELSMCECGTEKCQKGHSYGPAVRDHFLIHYILDGKGTFYIGDKVYNLSKGQGFLICPNVITFYQADFDASWSYSWVGFHGIKAESYLKNAGLTQESPIFTYTADNFFEKTIRDMIVAKKTISSSEIRLLGLLYLFLSQLIEISGNDRVDSRDVDKKELYVKKALDYIEMNYFRDITISGMASYIGLDRSYLGSLFRELVNSTPQEYLMSYRVNKACELMKNGNLSIGDIARSVGYDDQLLFSKVFRKIKNMPPRNYRKMLVKELLSSQSDYSRYRDPSYRFV